MKNILRLQKLLMLSIIFFVEQCDLYKLCACDEVVSPLLSNPDPLIESMNGLSTEITRLNGEIESTSCCIVPVPWKRLALARDYHQVSQNFINVDIPEEKELFDKFKKEKIDAYVWFLGLSCGSVCLGCLPLPISAISTAPILSTIGISTEVLAGVSCCCYLPAELSLFAYKNIAGKQLAIKQLYTTGHVDKGFKYYLNDYKNAFYMHDRHGNFVFDK